MWTVGDEVMPVVTQYPKGMRLVVEQHAIGALGSDAANEAFRERVRPGCARWRLDHIDAFGSEHRVEGPGELRVPISDQEPKRRGSLTQVHHHVTGLLGDPSCGRMGAHAENVYPPSRDFHDEQHVKPAQRHCIEVEEVGREQPGRLRP